MGARETRTPGGRGSNESGLVPGHAYTVLQVRQLREGAYKGSRVMLLRKCAQIRFTCLRVRRLAVRDEDRLNGSFLPKR